MSEDDKTSLAVAVYSDAASPAVKEVGTLGGRLARMTLAPLRAVVWGYERLEAWIEKEVGSRLEGIPPERIQEPPPHVVVPALAAVAYTTAEELRALFANLLAKSMDSASAGEVHPSFVEVIKQLTPDEAKILKVLRAEAEFFDVIQGTPVTDDCRMEFSIARGLTDLFDRAGCKPSDVAIDNIVRQNLAAFVVEPFSEEHPIDVADELTQYPAVRDNWLPKVRSLLEEGNAIKVVVRRLRPTSYGTSFYNCCVDEMTASVPTASPPAP